MPWKFANKHAFSRAHGRGEKHLSKLLLKKTKLKSPSNELFYSRDRGQPTVPLNCSKNMRLDFAKAPSIFSQSQTSNSIFSILIDSMYAVSLEDIMINKQEGFIVGCGFGIFVGHLG
jgi:hypothetical protein